jgi:hypothetical protein
MLNKKIIFLTAAGILLFDSFVLALVHSRAERANGGMPTVTLNDYQTAPNTVVSVNDICCYENIPCMYITSAIWQDGDPDLPVITDDGQAVLTGNRCGVMEVTVARNREWIIPEDTVTVTVGMPS